MNTLLLCLLAASPTTVKADDGHPIAVWETKPKGKAAGTVVLLHGRTWSCAPDFDLKGLSTMDALAARGYRVLAIDLRGYGKTARDVSGFFTPDRGVGDVLAVLGTLKEKPLLVGWSMGSLVSQLVAQQVPEKLSGVVLYGYGWDPDEKHDDADPVEPAKKANTAEAAAEDFIVPGSIAKASVDAYVKAALAADPVKVDLSGRKQWLALDAAKLKLPVLVLQGEKDPVAQTAVLLKLWAKLAVPNRQWVVLPGTDHAAHLETLGAFVDALAAFERATRPR